ncbi:MAG: thioredoxin domain-containing protein, partial [Acutalibacteraceae bacterium]
CKIAVALLEKSGVRFTKLLAEENADIVNEYGIKQAPTLIVTENGKTERYTGVSEIRKYISSVTISA